MEIAMSIESAVAGDVASVAANPYGKLIKWGIVAAVVLCAAGGGYWKGHHDETMVYDNYVSKQAAAAAQQAAASQQAARIKEEQNAQQIAAIQNTAAQSIAANAKRSNNAIAALRAGTLRLRIANTSAVVGSGVSATGAGPAGITPTSYTDIPTGLSIDVLSRLKRADDLAVRYNEALAVMKQDRVTCGGSPY
jgi:hypothetical protein